MKKLIGCYSAPAPCLGKLQKQLHAPFLSFTFSSFPAVTYKTRSRNHDWGGEGKVAMTDAVTGKLASGEVLPLSWSGVCLCCSSGVLVCTAWERGVVWVGAIYRRVGSGCKHLKRRNCSG